MVTSNDVVSPARSRTPSLPSSFLRPSASIEFRWPRTNAIRTSCATLHFSSCPHTMDVVALKWTDATASRPWARREAVLFLRRQSHDTRLVRRKARAQVGRESHPEETRIAVSIVGYAVSSLVSRVTTANLRWTFRESRNFEQSLSWSPDLEQCLQREMFEGYNSIPFLLPSVAQLERSTGHHSRSRRDPTCQRRTVNKSAQKKICRLLMTARAAQCPAQSKRRYTSVHTETISTILFFAGSFGNERKDDVEAGQQGSSRFDATMSGWAASRLLQVRRISA